MAELSKIKKQLKSVKATQKLTNAMSLVSQSKLFVQKKKLDQNREYARQYTEILRKALSVDCGKETNLYLVESKINNPLHIIIASNSGLCGSYNSEIIRFTENNISRNEPVFAIGNKIIDYLYKEDYLVIKQYRDEDNLSPEVVNKLIDDVLTLYRNDEISSIDIVYTEYINSLKYEPTVLKILPLEKVETEEDLDIEFEPSREEFLNWLIPQYISAVIYEALLQGKTSEHAARRSAMDSANNNAIELIESLEKDYNQKRQNEITQQVNEITAGYQNS